MVHPYFQAIADANISKMSKRVYIRHLITLTKVTGRTLEQLVKKPRSSYTMITEQYPNIQSRRTMIVAIKSIFKHVPELQCDYPDAYKKWHVYFKDLDTQVTKRIMAAEPTDRERVNWVHWADVVAKEKELSRTNYGSQDHLLLAMYVLIEPGRQEYNALTILDKKPNDEGMTRGNFLIVPENTILPIIMVLNDYKTAKTYSTYQRELPDDLSAIIRESLRQRPRKYLFTQEDGSTPYLKRNSFSKFSNKILEKLFGKKFTVGLLRHSFISEGIDFAKSLPGELFDAAKHMRHSISQQQLYRRKVDPVPVPTVILQDKKKKKKQKESSFVEQEYIDVAF
jgi:integrase